jgi:hypothetical protein
MPTLPRNSRLFLSLLLTAVLSAPGYGRAETRTVSWDAVTTYTDGTPIEPSKTVRYDIFWSSDAGLSPASLRTVASSVSQTSATFDPDAIGLPRGQTVYFTGDSVLSTGEKSALASPLAWTVPPVSPPPAPVLSGLSISGPASVNEGGSGSYTATATWSDGSTTGVTPEWNVAPSTHASIAPSGVLTALPVTSSQQATVNASFTSGGVTRTATLEVTIVEVGDATLPAPENVSVAGPVTTSPSKQFQLKWDPVASRADGTPIPADSVRYDAQWAADPSLAVDSWQSLGVSISATSVNFDPVAAGMPRNQRVYFTVQAKDTRGEFSPPSGTVSWVSNNQGPSSPKNGKIQKK